jgi:hypothetical protein
VCERGERYRIPKTPSVRKRKNAEGNATLVVCMRMGENASCVCYVNMCCCVPIYLAVPCDDGEPRLEE